MNKIPLPVDQRFQIGKGPARRLRASGKVPAVFYGRETEPTKITVDVQQFRKALDQGGTNPLFELQIRDAYESVDRTAILKERQINPLDGSIIHLDFIQVFMDETIEVTVPVEFVGKPVGVDRGGVFQSSVRDLQVSCLPTNMPSSLTADVSGLDVGSSLHISDLTLPPGVKVLQPEDTVLASVVVPKRGEIAEAEEEAVEGGEPEAEPGETSAE